MPETVARRGRGLAPGHRARGVTLADVWQVVHGDDAVLDLHGAHPDCPVGQSIQALLTDVDRRAQRAITDELATTTIAQLVAHAEAGADLHALT
jgi:DNA-binding IscR family transcriptional regulator